MMSERAHSIIFALLRGRQWSVGRRFSCRLSGPTTSIIPNLVTGFARLPIGRVCHAAMAVMPPALKM